MYIQGHYKIFDQMRKKGEYGGGGDYTWTFLVRFKGQFYGIK